MTEKVHHSEINLIERHIHLSDCQEENINVWNAIGLSQVTSSPGRHRGLVEKIEGNLALEIFDQFCPKDIQKNGLKTNCVVKKLHFSVIIFADFIPFISIFPFVSYSKTILMSL